MTDTTAEANELSAEQAIREVLKIDQRNDLLLQRVVGMTWMIWGVVSGGIFLSYEAIGLAQPAGTLAWLAFGLAWVPWAGMGAVATSVLWRSLALAGPHQAEGGIRVTTIASTAFLVIILGGSLALYLAHVPLNGVAWATIAVGVAAALVGGSGLTTGSGAERAVWLIGGALLAGLALAADVIALRSGIDPQMLFDVLGPAASTGLLFGGGLWTAMR